MLKKILVSAYACEPDKGSEPGVGWNWVKEISSNNEVWLITKKNNRESIEKELSHGQYKNIHPVYVDLPRYLTFWKKKQRGIRTYYYLWQFAALFEARRLHKRIGFDLGHHVTFVNDWIWTFFALTSIPYIWGPIGSHPKAPAGLLPTKISRYKDELRYIVQTFMRVVDPLYWLSAFRASYIIVINDQLVNNLPLRWFSPSKFIIEPAIGIEKLDYKISSKNKNGHVFLYVGRFEPVKAPHLAILAFAKYSKGVDSSARLVMIGEGSQRDNLYAIAEEYSISDHVEFIDWLPRVDVLNYFAESDVFIFPSLEGGGMVVLESMMQATPVVCLNYGGPGSMVDGKSGCKVNIDSVDSVVDALKSCMAQITQSGQLERYSLSARKHVIDNFLWTEKSKLVDGLYSEVLKSNETRRVD